MKYFYARVSTKGQNLDRQLDAADTVAGVAKIFCDKQSGKDFDRPAYNEMKSVLAAGDEVVVKSLDRLGRNKQEMKGELDWFKQAGVTLRVMDLPTTMIEVPVGQEWVLEMVNNILIEVLGTIAEQERETTRRRQREGISAMPMVNGKKISAKTGRGFGRPKAEIDRALMAKNLAEQKRGSKTVNECCAEMNISRATWYNIVKGQMCEAY